MREKQTADGPVRVFISYSHDSDEHRERVAEYTEVVARIRQQMSEPKGSASSNRPHLRRVK